MMIDDDDGVYKNDDDEYYVNNNNADNDYVNNYDDDDGHSGDNRWLWCWYRGWRHQMIITLAMVKIPTKKILLKSQLAPSEVSYGAKTV